MHGRGRDKRYTIGCTEDLSPSPTSGSSPMEPPMSNSPAPRARKTGLLTVKERPPGN